MNPSRTINSGLTTQMIELPVISDQEQKAQADSSCKFPIGPEYTKVRRLVDEHKLRTNLRKRQLP